MAITEKTLKSLHKQGLLKEPSKLQMLCSSPEMTSLIKKLSAPKYDPCRLFRKGDKVTPRKRDGRVPDDDAPCNVICEVAEDEEGGKVRITYYHGSVVELFHVTALYLELVTPVEELGPYSVSEATVQYLVKEDNKKVVAQFCKLYHPNAKAAAEAERDRLNAEYRKEQG